jgi:hypothetical protein
MIVRGGVGMPVQASERERLKFQVVNLGAAPGIGEEFARSVGDVLLTTEVRVDHRISTYLSSPDDIPLHTDHPDVAIIVWHCHSQDGVNGATVLADAWAAYHLLAPSQRTALQAVMLRCPSRLGMKIEKLLPLVKPKEEAVFFAPWLIPESLPPVQATAVAAFSDIVNNEATIRAEIRLQPGQALILNNHHMLHGRSAIEPGSTRWLTRYWIAASHAQATPRNREQKTGHL